MFCTEAIRKYKDRFRVHKNYKDTTKHHPHELQTPASMLTNDYEKTVTLIIQVFGS